MVKAIGTRAIPCKVQAITGKVQGRRAISVQLARGASRCQTPGAGRWEILHGESFFLVRFLLERNHVAGSNSSGRSDTSADGDPVGRPSCWSCRYCVRASRILSPLYGHLLRCLRTIWQTGQLSCGCAGPCGLWVIYFKLPSGLSPIPAGLR